MHPAMSSFSPASLAGSSFAPNLTGSDLSHDMAPVAGSGGLHIQFFYLQLRVTDPDPAKNGGYVTKLCIAKMPKGDSKTVATRFISEAQAMREYPQQFAQFKATGEVPTSGTPIAELPGISQAQIGLLLIHNIRSIEDLVSLPSERVQMMGIDVHAAWRVATLWLERKTENADLTEAAVRETALEQKAVAAETARIAAEQRAIQLQAQIDAMKAMGAGAQAVPGMIAQNALVAAAGAVPIEGDSFDAGQGEELFTGGLVSGSDDLNDPAPANDDPLGITRGKRGK
ncbi:hypothetical protein [Pseudogemmobacter sonorensis]|uniref:hypothetical protein n=1 Tax=Pseudogemmobacter sonorensis TaxID=2989681 RepID=UPI0036B1DBF7